MAAADRLTGNNLVVQWIHSGGTVVMNSGWRAFTPPQDEMNTVDMTAGGDAGSFTTTTYTKLKAKLDLMFEGTAGSATRYALRGGQVGTVNYGPNGTATGQPKGSFRAVVVKAGTTKIDFDKEMMFEVEFEGQGTWISHPDTATW